MNDNISVNWDEEWKRYALVTTNNPGHHYRHATIIRLLSKVVSNGVRTRLVDCGCGQGDLSLRLSHAFPGIEIRGYELSQMGVEICRQKMPSHEFIQKDLMEPIVPDYKYREWGTCAVCSEVIEHLTSPEIFLSNIKNLLKPGSPIIFTVPNGPITAFDRHLGHICHYSKDELSRLLQKCGYTVSIALSSGFPFFNLYRLVILLRGRKLEEDVREDAHSSFSAHLADICMALFRWLFRFNLRDTHWGWQTIVMAKT